MNAPTPTTIERQTYRLKFTLRTLLFLVVAVTLLLTFVVKPAQRQRSAVAILNAAEIEVHYDNLYEVPAGALGNQVACREIAFFDLPEYFTSNWRQYVLGKDYFHSVTAVSIGPGYKTAQTDVWQTDHYTVIDDLLPHLRRLSRLRDIFLRTGKVSSDVKLLLEKELPNVRITMVVYYGR